jgi:uncharacterized protein YkwD
MGMEAIMKRITFIIMTLIVATGSVTYLLSQQNDPNEGKNILNSVEINRFKTLLNEYRKQKGLIALKYTDQVKTLSEGRLQTIHDKVNGVPYDTLAKYMNEYFHFALYADVLGYQIDNRDKRIANIAENIAYFPNNSEDYLDNVQDSLSILIMNGWKNSKPHNKVLLSNEHDSFTLSAINFGYGVIVCYLGFYGGK